MVLRCIAYTDFFLETMLSLPSKLQLLLFLNSLVDFFKVTHIHFFQERG